ncbi:MAG: MetQ/NlpA family ABC transporter substrate-binding protein [Clostridium sp.]
MKKNLFKKLFAVALVGVLSVSAVACGEKDGANGDTKEKKELNIAVSTGPYNELFDAAVQPILEKQGYTIKKTTFTDMIPVNKAISEGSIDFNVAQHTAYAENFNKENNTKLTPIVHIPTVPAALFSSKHGALTEVANGQKVAIPKDPSNGSRAFRILVKAGWIKVKDGVAPTKISKNDVIENKFNLEFVEMESAQIPRALGDVDYAVIPGSVVHASKVDQKLSLLQEDVIKDLELVVVVDEKNVDTKWAKDIVAAYKSQEFKDYMKEHNKDNYWFIPEELK